MTVLHSSSIIIFQDIGRLLAQSAHLHTTWLIPTTLAPPTKQSKNQLWREGCVVKINPPTPLRALPDGGAKAQHITSERASEKNRRRFKITPKQLGKTSRRRLCA